MSLGKTVMVFGLGDLGGWVLEFLARQQSLSAIITADPREDYGTMKTNTAACGSGHMGYSKTMKFEKCDVFDIDSTAELLKKYNPDFIYASMTQLSWWVPTFLPHEMHEEILKIAGPMLPVHLTLISKLMRAVKKSGVTAPVLNNSWPDLTNAVLWRNGLGPLIGAGNLDLIVAEIRRKVSLAENIPIPEIDVYLFGEHVLNVRDSRLGIPYFLEIMVDGKDITSKFDTDSLVSDRLMKHPASQVSWISHPLVATSAVRVIMSILNDTGEVTHAPGPNGLIGGYPVRLSAKGAEVILPEGLTMKQAIKINTDGMKYEGVEEVKDDGTIVFTEEGYKITKEILGIDHRELRFEETEERSKEILAAYKKLAEKYKAPLYLY